MSFGDLPRDQLQLAKEQLFVLLSVETNQPPVQQEPQAIAEATMAIPKVPTPYEREQCEVISAQKYQRIQTLLIWLYGSTPNVNHDDHIML